MMWFNHGDCPENASYHYIVVPNVTEQELNETYNGDISTLSNNMADFTVGHDLVFGARNNEGTIQNYFAGDMHGFKIWNRALTPIETAAYKYWS